MDTLIDTIYRRHMSAVDKVCGNGTWIDRAAVGILLQLALIELADRAVPDPVAARAAEDLEYLRKWLDGHAPGVDIDQATPPAIRATQMIADLQNQALELAGTVVVAQNEAAGLRQQRANLQERLDAKKIDAANDNLALAAMRADLEAVRRERDQLQAVLLQERHTVATPVAVPVAVATPAATVPLSPEANEFWEGMERGSHTWRKLPTAIRLEMIQWILRQPAANGDGPMTMDEFNDRRPNWMPQANGLPTAWQCTWSELPTLALA